MIYRLFNEKLERALKLQLRVIFTFATKISKNTTNILNCHFSKTYIYIYIYIYIHTLEHQTKTLHIKKLDLILINSIYLVYSSQEMQRSLTQA